VTFALALLLAGQDWIADLDHDDPGVRERATRALRDLGDCAEPELRARLAEGLSCEAAGRVRILLGDLELERAVAAFPGGKETDGLLLAVRIEGDPEDPRREVIAEILNVGPGPRLIAGIRSWGLRLPLSSRRGSGDEAELRVKGGPPPKVWRHSSSISCGGGWTPDLLVLRRGERRSFRTTLDVGRLAPGNYALSAAYTALRNLEGRDVEVVSAEVPFEVGPPPAGGP
jgi:hypothetical protein